MTFQFDWGGNDLPWYPRKDCIARTIRFVCYVCMSTNWMHKWQNHAWWLCMLVILVSIISFHYAFVCILFPKSTWCQIPRGCCKHDNLCVCQATWIMSFLVTLKRWEIGKILTWKCCHGEWVSKMQWWQSKIWPIHASCCFIDWQVLERWLLYHNMSKVGQLTLPHHDCCPPSILEMDTGSSIQMGCHGAGLCLSYNLPTMKSTQNLTNWPSLSL